MLLDHTKEGLAQLQQLTLKMQFKSVLTDLNKTNVVNKAFLHIYQIENGFFLDTADFEAKYIASFGVGRTKDIILNSTMTYSFALWPFDNCRTLELPYYGEAYAPYRVIFFKYPRFLHLRKNSWFTAAMSMMFCICEVNHGENLLKFINCLFSQKLDCSLVYLQMNLRAGAVLWTYVENWLEFHFLYNLLLSFYGNAQ